MGNKNEFAKCKEKTMITQEIGRKNPPKCQSQINKTYA